MDINRKKRTLPVTCALLLALGLVLAPGNGFIAAAAETTVSVGGVSGGAGDTVGVSVTLRGLDDLAGVTGISGGQFELSYDPAVASVEKIRQGRAIGNSFLFLGNSTYTEKSIKVVWAAESDLITADGNLCTISFLLKKSGAVNPTIENLLLYDQDLNPLEVTPRGGNDTYVIYSEASHQPLEPEYETAPDQEGDTKEEPDKETEDKPAPDGNEPEDPADQTPENSAPSDPGNAESANRGSETAIQVLADIWRNPLLYLALAVVIIFLTALYLRRRAR